MLRYKQFTLNIPFSNIASVSKNIIKIGVSTEVNIEVGKIIPIFLISVPFVAVTRITTASFYATEESIFSYVLTYIEPLFMLVLPPLFGGQIMIWWSTVFARILSAVLSLVSKSRVDSKKLAV